MKAFEIGNDKLVVSFRQRAEIVGKVTSSSHVKILDFFGVSATGLNVTAGKLGADKIRSSKLVESERRQRLSR